MESSTEREFCPEDYVIVSADPSESQLGHGSFGVVYMMKNIQGNEIVACKIFTFRRASEELKDAVRNERMFLKKLRHPNIVRYLGSDETPTRMRIFMEYCEGGSLQDLVARNKRAKITPKGEEIFSIFRQLLDALLFCHHGVKHWEIDKLWSTDSRGNRELNPASLLESNWKPILHRDIKPDNVLVTKDMKNNTVVYKLCDFGLSKAIEGSLAPTSYVGTKKYMAPEIVGTGSNIWTRECDVFSLGATMYSVLNNGKLPYNTRMTKGDYDALQSRMKTKLESANDGKSRRLLVNLEYCIYRALDFDRDGRVKTLQLHTALVNPEKAPRTRKNGSDVNVRDAKQENTLRAASPQDNEAKVRRTTKNGADINGQHGKYGNALRAAAAQGNDAIVQWLIENGADINAQGGEFGSALQAAVARGNEKIVQLLIENGADINAQGGYYGNALQAAVARGNKAIVRLLIKKGADVNAQSGYYGNALQVAILLGNEEIVRLLVKNGADINAQDGEYGNALQAAVLRGTEGIVRLLIEKGADVNFQGQKYGNALQAAVLGGKKTMVRLLIEKGADVNAQGGYYGNALQAAVARGNEEIVLLLIKNDADINAQGGRYGNALRAAAARGTEAIVQLLIENGAYVTSTELSLV